MLCSFVESTRNCTKVNEKNHCAVVYSGSSSGSGRTSRTELTLNEVVLVLESENLELELSAPGLIPQNASTLG